MPHPTVGMVFSLPPGTKTATIMTAGPSGREDFYPVAQVLLDFVSDLGGHTAIADIARVQCTGGSFETWYEEVVPAGPDGYRVPSDQAWKAWLAREYRRQD